MKGTVKWFVDTKAFGFIEGEDGEDYFAKSSEIQGDEFKTLHEGETVEFERHNGPKGLVATKIKKLGGLKPEPKFLKPCPCCGNTAKLNIWKHSTFNTYRVGCTKCSIRTGEHYVEAEAIKTWNERTEDKVIASLEKAVKYESARYLNAVRAIVSLGGNTRALIGDANRIARERYFGENK